MATLDEGSPHLSRVLPLLTGHQSRGFRVLSILSSQPAGRPACGFRLPSPGQPHRAFGAAEQASHLPWHATQIQHPGAAHAERSGGTRQGPERGRLSQARPNARQCASLLPRAARIRQLLSLLGWQGREAVHMPGLRAAPNPARLPAVTSLHADTSRIAP